MNVDIKSVKTLMSAPGFCKMVTASASASASASGPDRATRAADAAGANRLLEGIDPSRRSARSQPPAKVDVLASHGTEEVEVAAFLRKHAD